jgi:hypothetical protein
VYYERDMTINPAFPWNQGPRHPTLAEVDLETVLLHEFGHMAGNLQHATGCRNSPLVDKAGFGEWWRSPSDWYRIGCPSPGQVASVAAATARAVVPAGELRVTRKTVVTLLD